MVNSLQSKANGGEINSVSLTRLRKPSRTSHSDKDRGLTLSYVKWKSIFTLGPEPMEGIFCCIYEVFSSEPHCKMNVFILFNKCISARYYCMGFTSIIQIVLLLTPQGMYFCYLRTVDEETQTENQPRSLAIRWHC